MEQSVERGSLATGGGDFAADGAKSKKEKRERRRKEILSGERRGFCSFYTFGEEIFNAVSHIAGGGIGLIFTIICLIFAYPGAGAMISVAVFGLCAVTLYTMSALYHFLPDGRAKGVFRIFDHCTIFLLIAGTYTPFCVIMLGNSPLSIAVLVGEWVLCALGVTGNAIAMNSKAIKILSMIFYLCMGWAAAAILPRLIGVAPAVSLWLLLAGGIAYTGGILFFALGKKVKYFHSVWHLFDIAGTVLQFLSILFLLIS